MQVDRLSRVGPDVNDDKYKRPNPEQIKLQRRHLEKLAARKENNTKHGFEVRDYVFEWIDCNKKNNARKHYIVRRYEYTYEDFTVKILERLSRRFVSRFWRVTGKQSTADTERWSQKRDKLVRLGTSTVTRIKEHQ